MTVSLTHRRRRLRGFSLLELSIVLFILALLGSSLMQGLAPQQTSLAIATTRQQLAAANEALLGFAMRHGRLPCPAKPDLADSDAAAGNEDCTRQHGVLPWATLALPASDAWGRRLTYYASNRFTGTPPANANAGFALDTDGNAIVRDRQAQTVAADLPAVILSHGTNGLGAYLPDGSRMAGASADEAENADADLNFVDAGLDLTHDDLLVWTVPAILKQRMVSAGRLP